MDKSNINRLTTILIYGRVPLIFGGLVCALGVMWTKDPVIYVLGVSFLFISMAFDISGVWIANRFEQIPALTHLADRVMDRLVYSIIFPLVAVGETWRLQQMVTEISKGERLHAIFVLILCITVLIRDNFAHFMRNFSIRKGDQPPEPSELSRLRILVAAPVAAILYAHAFYIPGFSHLIFVGWFSWFGNISLRLLFVVEIVFLVINFGSIARCCKKYGSLCLDELCSENDLLRNRILSFFPNTLTAMNAIMGLLSVFFAYQGRIQEAYLILMGAAFFDKLDGALARKLGLTQPQNTTQGNSANVTLGGILDDISDAISFCICPGWIFYIVFSEQANGMQFFIPLGFVAIFYAILGFARLIYFTIDKNPIPGFFKGLPTPAAALLVTAPIVIFNQSFIASDLSALWSYFCLFWIIIIAVMMNFYPIRYLHVGRFMDQHPWFTWSSIVFHFVFVFTPFFGHVAFLFMLCYLLSPLVTGKINIQLR